MKRSTDRILTTHSGSLPLPAAIRQAFAAKRRGEAYDEAVIDAALTTAIGEVVQHQIEVGIDIVDDGELSKTSWNDYVVHRLQRPRKKAALPGAERRALERCPRHRSAARNRHGESRYRRRSAPLPYRHRRVL